MTVAAAPVTIEAKNFDIIQANTDPLEVRWGINPVMRDKPLPARECGIAKAPLATFFAVTRFPTPEEIHTIDWTMPKEQPVMKTAQSAQEIIEEYLGGRGAQNRTNWGVKFGFQGVTDAAKMDIISKIICPDLSKIRAICAEMNLPQPISDVCEGTDEYDFGTRESCPTCWFDWLKSDACQTYIVSQAGASREYLERDPATGETQPRKASASLEELRTGRELALEAFSVGIPTLQGVWQTIAQEMDDKQRTNISPFEHEYRKDLHQNKPQDKQIAMVREFAMASQGGGNNADMNRIVETQEKTLVLLDKIADKVFNEPAPALPPTQPAQNWGLQSGAKTPPSAPVIVPSPGQVIPVKEEENDS